MDRKPESITHLHLLALVVTEMGRFATAPIIRILDLGCGNGHLIAYLYEMLTSRFPEHRFEVWGHDIDDYKANGAGLLDRTLAYLQGQQAEVPWHRFVRLISARDRWPYPDAFFHVILTNQVLEHVEDPDLVFAETSRVLRSGGFSANLFPFRTCVQEGHLLLPWAHRIQNFEFLTGYIRFMSRLGFGLYRRRHGLETLDQFSENYADYLRLCTHYMPVGKAFSLAKKHHLRISFPYTQNFYFQKLRSLLALRPRYRYRLRRRPCIDWLAFSTLKYLSCITMVLEKKDSYSDPVPDARNLAATEAEGQPQAASIP